MSSQVLIQDAPKTSYLRLIAAITVMSASIYGGGYAAMAVSTYVEENDYWHPEEDDD